MLPEMIFGWSLVSLPYQGLVRQYTAENRVVVTPEYKENTTSCNGSFALIVFLQ